MASLEDQEARHLQEGAINPSFNNKQKGFPYDRQAGEFDHGPYFGFLRARAPPRVRFLHWLAHIDQDRGSPRSPWPATPRDLPPLRPGAQDHAPPPPRMPLLPTNLVRDRLMAEDGQPPDSDASLNTWCLTARQAAPSLCTKEFPPLLCWDDLEAPELLCF